VRARYRLRGAPALSLRARSDSVGAEAHRFRTSREATVSAHAGISETFLGPGRSMSGRDGRLGLRSRRQASLSGARSWSLLRTCSVRGGARGAAKPGDRGVRRRLGVQGWASRQDSEQPRHRPLRRGAPGGTIAVRMAQALDYLLVVLLIVYIAYAAWTGAWYGTWCASGRKPGQRIPGVRPPEPR
jgi:hypothetical protein